MHTPPSWYTPLVTWLIGIPSLVWVGISTLIIIVALFRLKIIEIEKPLEPAEELQHQINTLLQPLTKKDKRFTPSNSSSTNSLKRILRQTAKEKLDKIIHLMLLINCETANSIANLN